MVLERGFESRLHLESRLDGKDGPLDGRKTLNIIKTVKWGKSHLKRTKRNERESIKR